MGPRLASVTTCDFGKFFSQKTAQFFIAAGQQVAQCKAILPQYV
jgi:hypothetical protein